MSLVQRRDQGQQEIPDIWEAKQSSTSAFQWHLSPFAQATVQEGWAWRNWQKITDHSKSMFRTRTKQRKSFQLLEREMVEWGKETLKIFKSFEFYSFFFNSFLSSSLKSVLTTFPLI